MKIYYVDRESGFLNGTKKVVTSDGYDKDAKSSGLNWIRLISGVH